MEIAEPNWCGHVRYNCCGVEEEEELTLTPHHTPSQSFDFIVWEKAYLDSIPAAAGSTSNKGGHTHIQTSKEDTPTPTPTLKGNFTKGGPQYSSSKASTHILHPSRANYLGASLSVADGPSHLKIYLDKEISVPSTSSQNYSTLMSCRTDADLPSFFFDYKPRISDGGLTNLEEAVRRYAERHPQVAAVSLSRPSEEQATTRTTHDKLKQLHVNNEALLKRSFSQPGGGSFKSLIRPSDSHAAVGCNKPTSKNTLAGRAVFGHPGIHHDQCSAGLASVPAQNHAKMSCFPTSPGRRKHGQSTLADDRKCITGIFKKPSFDAHLIQQEKHMSPLCDPTFNTHLQQQNKLLCPITTWADVMHMPAEGHRPTPLQDSDYRSSFSDMSSLSSNYDRHAVNMSKLKLWGLHHRFKALCKKLCSPF